MNTDTARYRPLSTFPIIAFVSGLGVSWAISSLLVYLANQRLYQTITSLAAQGHVTVPSGPPLASLTCLSSALAGSCFFVVTAGLLVTILALTAAIVTRTLVKTKTGFWTSQAIIWLCITVSLNWDQISIITLPFTLIIPGCTLTVLVWTTRKASLSEHVGLRSRPLVIFLITLIVAGTGIGITARKSIFLNTRDYVFFSSRAGTALTFLYYTYSPYAADVISPLISKQIKPCCMHPELAGNRNLVQTLFRYGWLVSSCAGTRDRDLSLAPAGNGQISLSLGEKTVATMPLNEFLKTPLPFLEQVSRASDTLGPLRFLCLAGLIVGIPAAIIALFFFPLHCFFENFVSETVSGLLALTITTLTIVSIVVYLQPPMPVSNQDSLGKLLASDNVQDRINALRVLPKVSRRLLTLDDTVKKLAAGSVPERFWLASALGRAQDPAFVSQLTDMTRDPSINVQYSALRALSLLPCNLVLKSLYQDVIKNNPSWYVQQNAYNAYRICP
ncbi:MAG: HEAT repeat domain-containing protein [Pseudomonadota bacterium]